MTNITVNAKKELKGLRSELKMCADGVTNVQSAVKTFRAYLNDASDWDMNLDKKEEYKKLDKHFSFIRLPKPNNMEDYCLTAIALINALLGE